MGTAMPWLTPEARAQHAWRQLSNWTAPEVRSTGRRSRPAGCRPAPPRPAARGQPARLHGAELRPAHRAEVRRLGGLLRQRRVVEQARGHGVERQVELVVPARTSRPLPGGTLEVVTSPCARGRTGRACAKAGCKGRPPYTLAGGQRSAATTSGVCWGLPGGAGAPAELEARLGQRVVPVLRPRVVLPHTATPVTPPLTWCRCPQQSRRRGSAGWSYVQEAAGHTQERPRCFDAHRAAARRCLALLHSTANESHLTSASLPCFPPYSDLGAYPKPIPHMHQNMM